MFRFSQTAAISCGTSRGPLLRHKAVWFRIKSQFVEGSGALNEVHQSDSVYSFGETDLAAERLRVVAEVFDPTSEAFLSEAVLQRPRLAIDLGCGPGFTTRLLAGIARPHRTVGVDRSEAFLRRARASSVAGEEYIFIDVAVAPFRIAGIAARPDLIYMRFLASHLPEPDRVIARWSETLEPGGILLIEEVNSITTKVEAFDQYLKILSQMLARHGNELFAGKRLATTGWNTDLCVEINRTTEVRPSTGQAARMFLQNLSNWRRDPYVKGTYPSDKLEGLAIDLDGLTSFTETGQITWEMRQICLRRKPY